MSDAESLELVERVRTGDQQAEDELFHRYVGRLVDLARSRISSKLARRLDPEDVVQSVYRSFFIHARHGRYDFQLSGDLWRLLAAITINKVRRQAKRHSAAKRAMGTEDSSSVAHPSRLLAGSVAREPSPEEVAGLVEELSQVFDNLSDVYRRVLELRLQGRSIEDVARRIACSERTVHRALAVVKQQLELRLAPDSDAAEPTL